MTESNVFRILMEGSCDEAVVIANGYLSRRAFHCKDRESHFYMIGSMGLAPSIALGVALAQPRRRVVTIDGDGNLLMALGALTMIGHLRPPNLMHLVVDNEAYASTGGQRSISGSIDLPQIARACGYRLADCVLDETLLRVQLKQMRNTSGPSFLQIKVVSASAPAARVSRAPQDIAQAFRQFVTLEPFASVSTRPQKVTMFTKA